MIRKNIKKILVPYDGSNYSTKALSRAIELAHNLDSQIYLYSVISIDYISPPGMLGLLRTKSEKENAKKWNKTVKKESEKMLKAAAKKCEDKGISVSYDIGRGNIANEILNFSKKKRISLIIMGSKGLHGLDKFKTLGSVSRKVSEHALCPVLSSMKFMLILLKNAQYHFSRELFCP